MIAPSAAAEGVFAFPADATTASAADPRHSSHGSRWRPSPPCAIPQEHRYQRGRADEGRALPRHARPFARRAGRGLRRRFGGSTGDIRARCLRSPGGRLRGKDQGQQGPDCWEAPEALTATENSPGRMPLSAANRATSASRSPCSALAGAHPHAPRSLLRHGWAPPRKRLRTGHHDAQTATFPCLTVATVRQEDRYRSAVLVRVHHLHQDPATARPVELAEVDSLPRA